MTIIQVRQPALQELYAEEEIDFGTELQLVPEELGLLVKHWSSVLLTPEQFRKQRH
ncbi:hypothetical protein [Paenibacillus sp. y28]|uniref:hypothetical protein n=1 Tax=Paenibacillus sp. y28 TaxID=3129110 RepID=UPI00301ADC4E